MANVKFVAVSRGLKDILDYVTNREKTVESLITGVNCVAESALDEFEAVKKHFRKTEGRSYYHIVQAFAPDDPLDFETAHEIGLKFAEHFKGYQCSCGGKRKSRLASRSWWMMRKRKNRSIRATMASAWVACVNLPLRISGREVFLSFFTNF